MTYEANQTYKRMSIETHEVAKRKQNTGRILQYSKTNFMTFKIRLEIHKTYKISIKITVLQERNLNRLSYRSIQKNTR